MSASLDWGDGSYERTAEALRGAVDVVLDAASLRAGEQVLDLGCGTGNAALAAARRGAHVLGVDPAPRLVAVARATAAREACTARFVEGDASAIPAADHAFDVALSVFGVIFAPDAARAVQELVRVTRSGGRIVITSWFPDGAIAGVGALLREAASSLAPAAPPAGAPRVSPPRWSDVAYVRDLFAPHGAKVSFTEAALAFRAASAAAWLAETEAHHPVWRSVLAKLAPAAADALHARSLAALEAGNEDAAAFLATSRYLVVRADLP